MTYINTEYQQFCVINVGLSLNVKSADETYCKIPKDQNQIVFPTSFLVKMFNEEIKIRMKK